MGTLTSSNLDSVHTSIFLIILYKPYAVAALEHWRPLPPRKLRSPATLPPRLCRASFHRITEFLHRSTTIELFSPFKLIALSTLSESKALLALAGRHRMLSIAINRSLNRSSNRDRVFSYDILPTTALLLPAASLAH